MRLGVWLATGGLGTGVVGAAVLTGLWLVDRPAPVSRGADPVVATAPARGSVAPSSPGAAEALDNAFLPAALTIPALGISASVTAVTVTSGGSLDVPTDPHVLGWWAAGPPPGSRAGSTVIDGHVDSARLGLGSLFELRKLNAADTVTVTGPGGGVTYRVTGVREYNKGDLPSAALFTRSGPPRLLVVTCGGPFDRTTGHYRDNIVASATPLTRAPAGLW